MTVPFRLSFDYRCPFAKNLHLHLITALRAGADFSVTFDPWTMSQGHRPEGSADVWDDERYDADLLALAYGTSIRDQQPEAFWDAHESLFRARHERGVRCATHDEINGVLSPLDVDLDAVRADVASRRPHQVIAETYRHYETLQAFGVPTLVLGTDATFIRYMKPPTSDADTSVELITSLVRLAGERADLNEFKHTTLPA